VFYDQINWPFHYLFMGFFLVSGLVFLNLSIKRRRDYAFHAARAGLDYAARGTEAMGPVLTAFDRFPDDDPGWASQLCHGQYRGLAVMVFNYLYRDGVGYEDMQLTRCLAWRLPAAPGDLTIGPTRTEDVVARDLVFFDDPVFSDRYRVHGGESLARALLDTDTLALILAEQSLTVEIRGDLLLIAKPGDYGADELAFLMDRYYPLARRAAMCATTQTAPGS